jgi:uncharacterized repeat protein (TIGR03803 family)
MPQQFARPFLCACCGFFGFVLSFFRLSKPRAKLLRYALPVLRQRVYCRSTIFTCAFLFLWMSGAIYLNGQTVTVTTFGSDPYDAFTNLIQGSDGNLYGVSFGYYGFPGDYSCPDGSSNECGFITRIAPDGTVTILHTFELSSDTGASDGYNPSSLIEAPDGLLYGTTSQGGSTGYGTIFKVTTTGIYTTIYTFPADGSGSDPSAPSPGAPNGTTPGPLVLGSDGNFYGTSQGAAGGFGFFQLGPDGTFKMLHAPDKSEILNYTFPSPLLQASDGNFYATARGTIMQITPEGTPSSIYTFPADGSGGQNQGILVEGSDGNLYGTSEFTGYDSGDAEDGKGNVFKVSLSGAYQQLYKFSGLEDGFNPNSELTVGTDGNFYGTTYFGGITDQCTDAGPGCGTVFKITPSATFTSLYKFSQTATDGQRPYGRMLQGADGNFIGSFNSDAVDPYSGFNLAVQPTLQAPVQLTFNPKSVSSNAPTTLTWSVLNAFSQTMQQCHASILGSATGASQGAGTWFGPQSGTLKGTVFGGTATITPTLPGTYTYVLNCGGIETGTATLSVGNGPTITTAALPNAKVSVDYSATLQATGGTLPYTWGATDAFPPGMTLDTTLGVIGGKPTQFGTYQISIGVQDSSDPQLSNTATFPLIVESTLVLNASLNNAMVGSQYNGVLQATGGYGSYKFALVSGTLPAGLALNSSSGAIAGTPTKAGKSTFTVSVSDGENPAAKVTQSVTLATDAPPLLVETGKFPDCTVGVVCEGQFAATGGTPPYTWKILPGTTFPAGLTLAADGGFTGTPTQHQFNYDLQVQVTDSATPPVMASGTNQLDVLSGLKIVSITLPNAMIGVAYASPAPVATGGLPPYTWTLVTDPVLASEYGVKPDGSIFSFSAGPKTAGSFVIHYTVLDSEKTPDGITQDATLTVIPATIPSTTVLSSSNTLAGTGMSVTLTAKVTKSSGIPTGVVTFSNGTSALGTAPLDNTGTASFVASFSATGTYSLSAAYSGDASSTGSVSAPLVETVVTPTISATATPGTLTIASGQSGTLTLTLTPTGGYTGTVTFSCGQLPLHVSCTFDPAQAAITAGTTTFADTLTVDTDAKTSAFVNKPTFGTGGGTFAALAMCLPTFLFALLRRKKPRGYFGLVSVFIFTLIGTVILTGCGGSSSKARPGTYSVPVNLTLSGGQSTSVALSVIVK